MATGGITECDVCFLPFEPDIRVPKILSCGHTFCQPCLQKLSKASKIPCPECTQVSDVSQSQISSLITNFRLYADVSSYCQECRVSTGAKACDHCSQRLCDSCHPSHQQTHVQATETDLQALCQALDKLQTFTVSRTTLQAISQETDKLKKEIKRVCDTYNQATEALRDRLLKKADDIRKQKTRAYKDWQQKVFQQEAEVKSCLQNGELDIADFDISVSLNDIQRQCEKLMQQVKATEAARPSLSKCILQTRKDIISDIAESVEILSPSDISPHTSPLTPASFSSLMPQYSRARLVKKVGGLGSADGEFNGPRGVICTPSGMVVVTDCLNHRLQMFTEDLEHVRSVGSEGTGAGQFNHPKGITTDSHGRICIADAGNHRNQVVDERGSHLCMFGSKGTSTGQYNNPNGITIDQNQLLYVCDNVNKRVQVVAADGRHLSTLTQTGSGPAQLRAAPLFISSSSDSHNHVIISDRDGNLYMFNDKGEHTRTLLCGQPGSFSDATGTVTDAWGTLLVADYKEGCVCVLGEDGQVSCRIGHKGHGPGQIEGPYGIALTNRGDLIVCDYSNNKILKYDIPKSVN